MRELATIPKERTGVRGFFRLQIEGPDGKLHGDSGWHENQIVNLGFNNFLCMLLGAMAGSSQISHMALGSGSEPGAADTTLQGEHLKRAAVTAASSNTSKRLRLTATFLSAQSFVSALATLRNLGLFAISTPAGGTIFAGNTYASSTITTNQNVNCTYDIDFG